ncbi:superoxide dismutase [Roseococcus sp.]|uniref:superoxide dismutase n=1 Tax=Roseococcus sp. TaxID=2109646 RepID=UPI003BAD0906
MAFIQRRGLMLGAVGLGFTGLMRPAFAQAPAAAPTAAPTGPFTLPPLGYAFDKNEAAIDARTMELHHRFHHQAYVTGLNAAVAGQDALARMPLDELVTNYAQAPEALRTRLRNFGGGHANHSMFWEIMGGAGGEPSGPLKAAIDRDLGGFGELKNRFNAAAMGVFGSGWSFVTVTREGRLAITTKPNQDSPLMDGQRALMGNDVWEHAYYLRYQNRRVEYVGKWWDVLDWARISARFDAAMAGTLKV